MTPHNPDVEFPACCVHCPHLETVTAACTHELRQSLVYELEAGGTCPVYSRYKTDAMRELAGSQ